MIKRNGFTLVELLAVIVILAIILAIAIPGISEIIKGVTREAFKSDAKMVLKAVNYKSLEDETFVSSSVNETNIKTLLNLDDSNYERLTVKEASGVLYVTIVGQNKWDGLTASGTKNVIQIDNTVDTFVRGANAPVLATNMVPIKWVDGACVEGVCAEGTWEDTVKTDSEWYNYDTANKRWANARTADGSMWVWIPRYIYRISSGWHTNAAAGGTIDIRFTKGVDDNWNKSSIGSIDLGETANASDNKWTNHPAFTFGDTELTGIWVAKFEATAAEGVANSTAGDNVTNKTVRIVPTARIWRYITINNIFTNSRNMETNSDYGWGNSGNGIDTHLIKNAEWGAVAYLSKSDYGQGITEIGINNNSNYTTGCGATAGSDSNSSCDAYNTPNGVKASTTGTIYGIYDMSGGSWEYVAAYVNNGNASLTDNGSSVISADSKYKKIYAVGVTDDPTNNYPLTINFKGDALHETSSSGATSSDSWFSDYSSIPRVAGPWLERGGWYGYGSGSGVFGFGYISGAVSNFAGFRPVLAVNAGL